VRRKIKEVEERKTAECFDLQLQVERLEQQQEVLSFPLFLFRPLIVYRRAASSYNKWNRRRMKRSTGSWMK